MAMPAGFGHEWTLDEVDRLIDAREGSTPRYELAQGELLVTPAPTPRHQRLVVQLALDDVVSWQPTAAAESFQLDVREFFASVRDAGPLP